MKTEKLKNIFSTNTSLTGYKVIMTARKCRLQKIRMQFSLREKKTLQQTTVW